MITLVCRLIRPIIIISLVFVLGTYAHAQDKRVKDLRIVSLSPAVTESLYLLGLKENIVGVTQYCNNPPEARAKERIGTVMEPDLEKIVKLRPDLILAMGLTDQKSITKLRNLGFTVMTYAIPDTFSGICDVFLAIGEASGRPVKARRIVENARARVFAVQKITSRLDKPRVLIQLGAKPFFVATRDFFMNDYLDLGGAINVFRDAPSGSVGREEAIIRNPDVIFIVTMGLESEGEMQAWKRYASVGAVKKGRIYSLNSDDVCSPTPASFADALKKIAAFLHPQELKGWK
ncbi:MAG: ABC transporter substrate-binding protein [Syntrophorhabdaceae bacterium]